MEDPLHIRRAEASDADQISAMVQRTLRISNAADYTPQIIDRVVANFSPDRVRHLLEQRMVLIAVSGTRIVGTASLDGTAVRAVFVDPTAQGLGVGRRLMAAVETLGRQTGVTTLQLPASLTAQKFYTQLGYTKVREVMDGGERVIHMSKPIG